MHIRLFKGDLVIWVGFEAAETVLNDSMWADYTICMSGGEYQYYGIGKSEEEALANFLFENLKDTPICNPKMGGWASHGEPYDEDYEFSIR